MVSIREHLRKNRCILTSEIVPPVTGDIEELLDVAAPFKDRVARLNVTDGPGASVHMSSVVASGILAQHGPNPIMQLTCRDRNRIALQADLLGASALGVRDVLFLTGDDPSAVDQPEAQPVFDATSVDLLRWSQRMTNDAVLPSGKKIASPPGFFCGAADVPVVPSKGWVPEEMLKKAEAGAEFIQTQLCYQTETVNAYVSGLSDHGLTERLHSLI